MNKKDLKFYETPTVEVVDVELEGALLDASFSDDQGGWEDD